MKAKKSWFEKHMELTIIVSVLLLLITALWLGNTETTSNNSFNSFGPEASVNLDSEDEHWVSIISSGMEFDGPEVNYIKVINDRDTGGAKKLSVSYISFPDTLEKRESDMEYLIGLFLGSLTEDWDIDELSVTVTGRDKKPGATWGISRESKEAYISGNLTIIELLQKTGWVYIN